MKYIPRSALFNTSGAASARREHYTSYDVETISLKDLLNKYGAPREIDFLSIDTEGSELDILNAFDFDKYSFRVIVCEHNHEPMRESIHALLDRHGYARKFQALWDDWYVKA